MVEIAVSFLSVDLAVLVFSLLGNQEITSILYTIWPDLFLGSDRRIQDPSSLSSFSNTRPCKSCYEPDSGENITFDLFFGDEGVFHLVDTL